MAKKRIFTVGCTFPGEEFQFVGFKSDQTLLDADIVVFEPQLRYATFDSFNGKPRMTESSSFEAHAHLIHWRSEILSAVNAGKLVIIFLARPEEAYRYTGRQEISGTGRSRVRTDIVAPVSSYEAVPRLDNVTPKAGKETRLEKSASFLAPYWSDFAEYSAYEVEIEGKFTQTLISSKAGNRIVGAEVRSKEGGSLIFLPPLRYDEDKFTKYDGRKKETYWTPEAQQFGKRLVAALVGIADILKESVQVTPPPAWAAESQFRLLEESKFRDCDIRVPHSNC